MAEHSDGSIIIDTDLNSEGFKAGSSELLSAIKSLTKEIKQLGTIMQSAFSGSEKAASNSDARVQQLEGTVQSLEAKAQSLSATVSELETKLAAANQSADLNPEGLNAVESAALGADSRVSELEDQVQTLEQTLADLQDQMASAGDQAAIPGIDSKLPKESVSSIQREIDKLAGTVDKLGPAFDKALDGNDSAMDTFSQKASEAEKSIENLNGRLHDFAQVQIPTDEYKQLSAEVSRAEKKLFSLYDRQDKMEATGVKKNSRAWKTLQYDIQVAEEKLNRFEAAKAGMENSGTAFTPGIDTSQLQQYEAQIRQLQQRINEMQQQLAASTKPASILQRIASGVGSAFRTVGKVISGTVVGSLRIAQKVGSGLWSVTKKIGSNLASAAGKLATSLLKAVTGMNALGRSTQRTGSQMSGMRKSVGQIFNMLKFSLAFRAFGAIGTAITEGIQSLAQYSNAVNGSISSITSANAQLKNSFATAFAPILSIVAPVLTRLINLLSTAITYIGMFFAALSGAKSFTRATAVQKDYAKSLKATGAAAGGAAKEAKKQLAAFDELNILTDDSSSGGGGGGAGGGDIGAMFEEVPIETTVSDFIQSLKDAFANGEYAEIGRIIGGKINEVFQTIKDYISWEHVGATLTKYITIFCEIFNGLVDGIDWDLIGSTVAAGVNTIVNSLYLLLTGIDWRSLGAAISTGLNGLVRDVDWAKLGQTLAAYFNARLSAIHGAIKTFDWKGAGSALGSSLSNLITSLNWAEMGQTFSDSMIGVLNSITAAIAAIDWLQFGEDIKTFICNVDWTGIIDALMQAINAAAAGLHDFLVGLFGDAWNGLVAWWHDVAYEDGQFTIRGLLDGILAALCNIGSWLNEHVVQPIINAFKSLFGISSPSTVMAELGGYLVEGLLQGISNMWTKITGFFAGVTEFFSGVWDTISGFFADVGTWFTDKFSGLGEAVSTAVGDMTGWATGAWDTVTTTFSTAKEKVSGWFTGLGESISDAAGDVAAWASNGWSSISASLSTAKDTVTGWFTGIGENVTTAVGDITSWATDAWSTISGTFADVGTWFSTTFSGVWPAITGAFADTEIGTWFTENVWDKITGAFSGVYDWFSGIASDIWNGLTAGLSADVEAVKETVVGYFSGIWDSVLDFFGIHSPSTLASDAGTNVVEGFSQGAESQQTSAGERLSAVFSGIYNAAKSVWDGVTGWLSKLFGWGSAEDEASATAESKATQAASNVASGVDTAFTDVSTSISEPIATGCADATTAFTDLQTTGETVAAGIVTAFSNINTEVSAALTSMVSDCKTAVADALDGVSTTVIDEMAEVEEDITKCFVNARKSVTKEVSEIEKNISSKFKDMDKTISNFMKTVLKEVIPGFENADKNVAKSTESIYDTIDDNFSDAASVVQKAVGGIVNDVDDGFASTANTANRSVSSMRTAISSSFAGMSSTVSGHMSSIKLLVTSGFTGMASNVSSSIGTITSNTTGGFGAVKKAISSAVEDACSSASSKFSSLASTITSKTNSVKSTVSSGFSSVKSSIVNNITSAMNTVSNKNWYSIGSNIVSGIKNGLNGSWSVLTNLVKKLASNLLKAAKNALGIHSPSKLFRDQVGYMLGLGTAEGMSDSQPAILKAVSSVADRIAKEMRAADTSVSLGVNGTGAVDGLDNVLSSFSDRVSDSFSNLLNKLSAIASSVTFATPAIATGSVLPYGVSAKTENTSAESLLESLTASNDDLSSVVIQSVTNATSAIVRAIQEYGGANINVDADGITTTVIREINRRTRATGQTPLLI